MPWALVLRLLARLAASLFVWRLATARRGSHGAGGAASSGPGAATASTRLDTHAVTQRLLETTSLGWRIIVAGVFIAIAALLLTAGVTLTVLSPLWLGIVLLVLAAAAVVIATGELRVLAAMAAQRRRRAHDTALRREIN